MASKELSDLSHAQTILRSALGWSQSLALFIAELAIGEASWRRRLQGYA